MKVSEDSRGSHVIDDNRLEDLIGGFAFRVGAISLASWELEQKKPGAGETLLALLAELQSIVRQLPIVGRPDDTLDLSQLPDWARATLERRFLVLLRCLLRVPASELGRHA
jgi:hypothetical protein